MANPTIPGTEEFRKDPGKYSYITPYGYQSGSCGYCKDVTSSGSYFAATSRLTPAHYQSLVDLGWRRSGTMMYLPDPIRSCCPHYTIRLPVADFVPTRDQRQAVNRWNRLVLGENYAQEAARRRPKSREEKRREQNKGFDFSAAIHESETSLLPTDPKPAHNYTVTLEPDTFTEEKYQLFAQYQREVHHEGPSQISRKGFERFLCSSPLLRSSHPVTPPNASTSTTKHLGSFHQLHRLDGKLIAMSVLDLLPRAVSAVYFVYDISYSRSSLGKVSVLREAALALESGHEYYYMGYYIHGCAKMRYKNDYRPQYFLDWESRMWERLDAEALKALDESKYFSPAKRRRVGARGDEEARSYETVKEAEEAVASLYKLQMPGLVPLRELVEDAPPDKVLASAKLPEMSRVLGRNKGVVLPVTFLGGWSEAEGEESGGQETSENELERRYLGDPSSLVTIVTDLCAAVGVEVAKELIVDFGGGVVDGI